MADPIRNFFKSTLVGTYSNTDTSLTVATGDGALLPDPSTDGAFNLTIFEGVQVTGSTSFEIVRVTARSGDVLTVTRGAESTTPLTIGSATHSILMSATKKTFDDINDAIDNVDLTTLTGVEELTFDSTGDEEFGLPAGTKAQRPASPSNGYIRYNTDENEIEAYKNGRWQKLSTTEYPIEVEYLVIAGGGGGGANTGGSHTAGGGGAGGYRSSVTGESSGGGASAESTLSLTDSTNYTVTVGAGGSGAGLQSGNDGSNGSNSVFSTITSTGGGGGGKSTGNGLSGGSGGGSGSGQTGGTGTTSQGFAGGVGTTSGDIHGGGGGGASEAGDTDGLASGGDGVSSSITGSSVTRAGGGGGGQGLVDGGSGGSGGGGNGAGLNPSTFSSAGSANTGGGGGGGGGNFGTEGAGASGGSGVVILRYPSDYSITIGAGLTGSETTDGNEKYAVITAGTGNVSWS